MIINKEKSLYLHCSNVSFEYHGYIIFNCFAFIVCTTQDNNLLQHRHEIILFLIILSLQFTIIVLIPSCSFTFSPSLPFSFSKIFHYWFTLFFLCNLKFYFRSKLLFLLKIYSLKSTIVGSRDGVNYMHE